MRKIEILTAICENPGWQPPAPASSKVDTALIELQLEGWIVTRLDGWEASPKAVECYPHFDLDDDGRVQGVRMATSSEEPRALEEGETVATVMLDGMGYEVVQDNGRFKTLKHQSATAYGEPRTAISDAFGHYDSLRLLVRIADLLGRK